MVWRLFVLCKNLQCGVPRTQILLPYSIPVETDAAVPPLPQDMFPASIVCRDCEQWSVYTAEDHEWSQVPNPPRVMGAVGPRSWTVKIRCGQPDCTSITKWHVQDDSGLGGPEIVRLVYAAKPEIVCEQGHSLLAPQSEIVSLQHD